MRSRNRVIGWSGCGGVAFAVLLLLGVSAQTASANPEYDDTSLDGNLQSQCTQFLGTIGRSVSGTAHLTVSASCNKEGSVEGTADSVRQATSLDLSSHVVWDTTSQAFTWDGVQDENNNAAEKCTGVRGFDYSATDVTLQLTCTVASTDGSVQQVSADLPLNGKVTAGTDGNLARR